MKYISEEAELFGDIHFFSFLLVGGLPVDHWNRTA